MSWYRKYTNKRSIGCVLHYLEYYCGLHVAEYAQVGGMFQEGIQEVTLSRERIAEYVWDGLVPVFTFYGESADRWKENQKNLRKQAIEDGIKHFKEINYAQN